MFEKLGDKIITPKLTLSDQMYPRTFDLKQYVKIKYLQNWCDRVNVKKKPLLITYKIRNAQSLPKELCIFLQGAKKMCYHIKDRNSFCQLILYRFKYKLCAFI